MSKRRTSPEETKARLVNAGLHLFGAKGFESTRTRELADLAGVNQAAIPYHFGGKEGLYLAVAHNVVERGKENLQEKAESIQLVIETAGMDREAAGQLLIEFIHTFLDRVVMAEDIGERSRFMMRELSSPGAGFDIIYNGFMVHMHKLVCLLVGKIVGGDPEAESVVIRAQVVMGTALSMIFAKTVLHRRLGWDGYSPEKMDDIKRIIAEIVAQGLQLDNRENAAEAR